MGDGVGDLKKLVREAMAEARGLIEYENQMCLPLVIDLLFFKFTRLRNHNWGKWVRTGQSVKMLSNGSESVAALIHERRCKRCGLSETKSTKFGAG